MPSLKIQHEKESLEIYFAFGLFYGGISHDDAILQQDLGKKITEKLSLKTCPYSGT